MALRYRHPAFAFATIAFASCLATPVLLAQTPALDRIVARADTEVLRSIAVSLIAARAMNATTAQYLAQVQPYAPLDLQILRVNVPAAISRRIRDFYIAAIGKEEQIDVAGIQSAFTNCGQSCTTARRDSMVASLDVARSLIKFIRGLDSVTTIAAWSDGWSVDSLMYRPSGYTVRMHSPVLALVPWREGPVESDAAATFLQTIGTSLDQVKATVATMRAHKLAAVTTSLTGNARVVMATGLGPAAAGLLFLGSGNSAPTVGGVSRIGDIYTVVTRVAPHIYYYETR